MLHVKLVARLHAAKIHSGHENQGCQARHKKALAVAGILFFLAREMTCREGAAMPLFFGSPHAKTAIPNRQSAKATVAVLHHMHT